MIIQSTNPHDILSLFHAPQHDRHVKEWAWHMRVISIDPDFYVKIERRQAAKRAAGIGPEGLCHG